MCYAKHNFIFLLIWGEVPPGRDRFCEICLCVYIYCSSGICTTLCCTSQVHWSAFIRSTHTDAGLKGSSQTGTDEETPRRFSRPHSPMLWCFTLFHKYRSVRDTSFLWLLCRCKSLILHLRAIKDAHYGILESHGTLPSL